MNLDKRKLISLLTRHKVYLVTISMFFLIFVGLLYRSYVYKLGYLDKATYLFFGLTLISILLNIIFSKFAHKRFFWFALLVVFLYAIFDKKYRIHNQVSFYLPKVFGLNPKILVNIFYITGFSLLLLVFIKFLITELKQDPDWVLLVGFAVFLYIIAIALDIMLNDITEDYFELFSLYFFTAGFFLNFLKDIQFKKHLKFGSNHK